MKYFKKIDTFLNEGILTDASTIFVSAIFGRSLFEVRKINLKLCVNGINNILSKAYDEFTQKNINESVDYYDQVMDQLKIYIDDLKSFTDSLNKKIIDKELAKKMVITLAKIDRDYFSPSVVKILNDHSKDFNQIRLISSTRTTDPNRPFTISKQDIDSKVADLAVLNDTYSDLVRDMSDIDYANQNIPDPNTNLTIQQTPIEQNQGQNIDPNNPDYKQIMQWLKEFPDVSSLQNLLLNYRFSQNVSMKDLNLLLKDLKLYKKHIDKLPKKFDKYQSFIELQNDIIDLKSRVTLDDESNNSVEITNLDPKPWNNGKRDALTNYLIETYKKEINEYLVDIAKSKFTNPTAKARVEYNKTLTETWTENKDELLEKWKNYYSTDKLSKFFEVGIKMQTTKLYDYKEDTDNSVAQRVLEKMPFIDGSSLEAGISKLEEGNFYMVPLIGNNEKPTPHCIIFYVIEGEDQITDESAVWAMPIAKVRFNNFKYKVEDFYLDNSNKLLSTSPLFLVTNTKANFDIDGQKLLLIKTIPNEFNMLTIRHIRVESPEQERKENHLFIGSPIYKLLSSEIKDKFKIDKDHLEISFFPKDKSDIEGYFFRQKRTKKEI